MRRGSRLPGPPSPLRATLTASRSDSPARACDRWRGTFNTSFAQRQLRARGRNWCDGRIAECPRLQQKSYGPLINHSLSSSSSYLSATPRMKPQRVPPAMRRAGRSGCRRAADHLPGRDSRCWHAAGANRVVHSRLTTSRPQRSEDLAEKQANPPLFFSTRLA